MSLLPLLLIFQDLWKKYMSEDRFGGGGSMFLPLSRRFVYYALFTESPLLLEGRRDYLKIILKASKKRKKNTEKTATPPPFFLSLFLPPASGIKKGGLHLNIPRLFLLLSCREDKTVEYSVPITDMVLRGEGLALAGRDVFVVYCGGGFAVFGEEKKLKKRVKKYTAGKHGEDRKREGKDKPKKGSGERKRVVSLLTSDHSTIHLILPGACFIAPFPFSPIILKLKEKGNLSALVPSPDMEEIKGEKQRRKQKEGRGEKEEKKKREKN